MTLTPREMQICDLLDMTRREIGQELGISHRTVQAHLKSIFDKMGVHSRVEVALKYQFLAGVGVDANGDTQRSIQAWGAASKSVSRCGFTDNPAVRTGTPATNIAIARSVQPASLALNTHGLDGEGNGYPVAASEAVVHAAGKGHSKATRKTPEAIAMNLRRAA